MKSYRSIYEAEPSTYASTYPAAAQPTKLDLDTLLVQPLDGMLAKFVGFIPDFLAAHKCSSRIPGTVYLALDKHKVW